MALRNPTIPAMKTASKKVGIVTFIPVRNKPMPGACDMTEDEQRRDQAPENPAGQGDNDTASPMYNLKIDGRVKPSVFSTATSRVRSRIDIAIVVADTSSVAKMTAKQMLRINAFTLPMLLMKLS